MKQPTPNSPTPLPAPTLLPLLQLRGLCLRYGGLRVTDDLSLDVTPGQCHAVIGPNGAGKTSLIHLISGAVKPQAGQIVFDGHDLTAKSMHQRVALGLARSYQITQVFGRHSVLDNLALAVQARSGSSLAFWRPVLSESTLFAQAAAVAERVGLGQRLGHLAGTLSHGEQRQLELGLALATAPRLLLLDEPMAGLGADESAHMLALLQQLRRELSLVLVEHDMDVVFQLADTVSVLVQGRVIASGAPQQVRADPHVKAAYLGDEQAVATVTAAPAEHPA